MHQHGTTRCIVCGTQHATTEHMRELVPVNKRGWFQIPHLCWIYCYHTHCRCG